MKMYNILLLNNTENYHSGCKVVIDFYRNEFRQHNLTIANDFNVDVSRYDLVVANGEGTMHHDAAKAYKIIDLLCKSKKSMLVNSVWQHNNKKLTEKLTKIDYVSVREVKSQREIFNQIGVKFPVCLDFSYFAPVNFIETKKYNILSGNRMNTPKVQPKRPKIKNVGEDGTVDIFTESWDEIVSKIKNCNLFVTGRHHELYAACKAETPFVVIEGNTHKNQGLFETAGVNIPTLNFNSSSSEIKKSISEINNRKLEYEKLFLYMRTQKKPELLKNVGMV
jgi:polysaccharide pyruvyl transferase WcaK-like protein